MSEDNDQPQAQTEDAPAPAYDPSRPITPQMWSDTLYVLQCAAADGAILADIDRPAREALQRAAGMLMRPTKKQRKNLVKELKKRDALEKKAHNQAVRRSAKIREIRDAPIYPTPPIALTQGQLGAAATDERSEDTADAPRTFTGDRKCYVCKGTFRVVHHFYDQMCGDCGDFNFAKRSPQHDLTGRIALVTGARVKIGYHAAVMLLRNGCEVVVTTRFPKDAAARYAKEVDASDWLHRLHVVGLDLRHTPTVEQVAHDLSTELSHLDFIIHNACQTVRRPPNFYAHLMDGEGRARGELSAAEQTMLTLDADVQKNAPARLSSAERSQVALDADKYALPDASAMQLFPSGVLDADLQQVDLRDANSWRMTLSDVPTTELLEVMLVNAVAPFVLSSRLKPLMMRTAARDKHIVNVSAVEGQFYRSYKTDKHPHTNMAKAALNMLTRTSAITYVNDGIHMNAVDTGWVTDEDPVHLAREKERVHGFSPPLDIVDGAARIVDPIFDGLRTNSHIWGLFLKDYKPCAW